jgi:hypothetical protein
MKAAAAILILFASLAQAQTARMPNQAGGEIVLTSHKCTMDNGQHTNLRTAWSVSGDNRATHGCWAYVDEMVHVVWARSNGERDHRVYKLEDFQFKDSK